MFRALRPRQAQASAAPRSAGTPARPAAPRSAAGAVRPVGIRTCRQASRITSKPPQIIRPGSIIERIRSGMSGVSSFSIAAMQAL